MAEERGRLVEQQCLCVGSLGQQRRDCLFTFTTEAAATAASYLACSHLSGRRDGGQEPSISLNAADPYQSLRHDFNHEHSIHQANQVQFKERMDQRYQCSDVRLLSGS